MRGAEWGNLCVIRDLRKTVTRDDWPHRAAPALVAPGDPAVLGTDYFRYIENLSC